MMLSTEGGENFCEDSTDVKLLNEIDAIRKALCLDIKTSKNSGSGTYFRSQSVGGPHLLETKSNLKSFNEEKEQKEKRSLWRKTLMAFSHIRNRKFDCCFTLQVHSIEGLPPVFNDVSLCVYWKRREKALVTQPAKVYLGTAEFEEELIYTCSVYGSRSGLHHSAKYEAKHFLLYASIYGEPELDLGKHRIDLTRLLPLTLEELEEEKSSGKWTTSYKLSGIGKGARLNISFGYSVITNSSSGLGNQQKRSQHDRYVGKAEMKFGKSDSKRFIRRTESLPSEGRQRSDLSLSVEDIKDLLEVLPVSLQELAISMDVLSKKLDEDKLAIPVDCKYEHDTIVEHVDPSEPKLFPLCDRENENCVEFQVSEPGVSSNERFEKDDLKSIKLDCKDKLGVSESSLGSDDDTVATEFLSMLEIEHSPFSLTSESEPDSPRERLLRKFEEALTQEWASNETAFQHSPPNSSCGFGSPAHSPQNTPTELAVLGDGLGPILEKKNGGFVFNNAKSGRGLIIQVSSPVVLPAEMSSGIMEELQRLASVGIERISMQSSNEDCTSRDGSNGENERGKQLCIEAGSPLNNFAVAISTHLRDPWRNYQPNGTPIRSLIQVADLQDISEEDDELEPIVGKKEPTNELPKEASEEKAILQFGITEVHVAGIKTKPFKKLWGSSHQQKSGSRWLISNGMGKNNKHPLMKSKAQPGDKL